MVALGNDIHGELGFSRTLVASFLEEMRYVTRMVPFFLLGEPLYLARKNKEAAGLPQSFAPLTEQCLG